MNVRIRIISIHSRSHIFINCNLSRQGVTCWYHLPILQHIIMRTRFLERSAKTQIRRTSSCSLVLCWPITLLHLLQDRDPIHFANVRLKWSLQMQVMPSPPPHTPHDHHPPSQQQRSAWYCRSNTNVYTKYMSRRPFLYMRLLVHMIYMFCGPGSDIRSHWQYF